MPRTTKSNLSIEGNSKGDLTFVVSKGDKVIRHTLNVDEMYSVSSMLTGRLYAKAKKK